MMQESVYSKLVPNSYSAEMLVDNIYKNRPPDGLVQAIRITEKQYAKMDCIVGESASDVLDSDERLVII